MNKKVLGLIVPYFKNSEECESAFKELMEKINKQLTDGMILYIYEDGQCSEWLSQYDRDNIIIDGDVINKGVSYARNVGLDYMIDKVKYILFLDSDDIVSDDYLAKMYEWCADDTHEVVESTFYINDKLSDYNPSLIRCSVIGSAMKTSIIGEHRFREKLQIAEDTTFMNEVLDLSKHRKRHCPAVYTYRFGINPNSLIKRYNRKEIEKDR